MTATRLDRGRGRELPSPRRVGSGCSQYSRASLDLDILYDRVVVQVHRYSPDNMVPLRAILRRLNGSSSSLIHSV
eukprot:8734162-Pyramimonas_sp.AAC.1